jgi:hypothetical protein
MTVLVPTEAGIIEREVIRFVHNETFVIVAPNEKDQKLE